MKKIYGFLLLLPTVLSVWSLEVPFELSARRVGRLPVGWELKPKGGSAAIVCDNGATALSLSPGSAVFTGKKFPVAPGQRLTIEVTAAGPGRLEAGFYGYTPEGKWIGLPGRFRSFDLDGATRCLKAEFLLPKAKLGALRMVLSAPADSKVSVTAFRAALDTPPPPVDYAAGMRRQPGEILPKMPLPSLIANSGFADGLKGWTPIGNGAVSVAVPDGRPALRLNSRGGLAAVYSDPISVRPGEKYLLTAMYHTVSARFGTASEIQIVDATKAAGFAASISEPAIHTPLVRRAVFNCRPGQWRRVSKYFTPAAGQTEVRLVLALYGTPGEINWGDLHFNLETPDTRTGLNRQFTRSEDPVPPPDEVLKRLAARPDSTAELRANGEAASIFIDGRAVPPHIYFGDSFDSRRSKRVSFQRAGVPIQFISLNNVAKKYWIGDRKYDFKAVDAQIMDSVAKNPEGNYVVRVDLSPYKFWYKDFPDTVSRRADGTFTTSRHGLFGPADYWSTVYRRAAEDYLLALISHMRRQPYYRAVVGVFPSGGEDQQFYYQSDKKGVLNDGMAPDSLATFRRFLTEKYGTDAALRTAWKRPEASLSSVGFPVGMKRVGSGCFLSPENRQPEIDYVEYLNITQGEFANRLCDLVKKSAGKPVLTVMWWGRGGAASVYPFYSQSRRIFPSRAMDLMGAQSGYYGRRETGSACFYPWVFDSARIHGKIMMDEGDYRTWQTSFVSLVHDYRNVRFWTLEEFSNAALREIGKMAAVGGGYWHFPLTAGWYLNDGIMDFVAKVEKVWEKLNSVPATFTPAELVIVADEDSYYTTTEQINVLNGANYYCIRKNQDALQRSGLRYDFYYLNDLIQRNSDGYKVYVFSNLFRYTPEKKAFIDRLKSRGKTLVFLYAPGYLNGVDAMRELTGIRIGAPDFKSKLADFVPDGSALTANLSGVRLGHSVNFTGERFFVTDTDARTIARYGDGKSAGAVRELNGWRSIYLAVPSCFTPEFLQNLARLTGMRIFNRTPGDMFIYHRDDLIVLHGVEGNENRLVFPEAVTLTDLMSDKVLLRNGREVSVKIQAGETKLIGVSGGKAK